MTEAYWPLSMLYFDKKCRLQHFYYSVGRLYITQSGAW